MKKHNFSAGPAILPASVLEQAARATQDLNGSGLSILEISHRSKEFVEILEKANSLASELLNVPDQYAVLFLTGGASTQFFLSAMNLLPEGGKAAYLDTGSWSAKAIKEARLFGDIDVVASSKSDNYTHIPKDYVVPEDASYLHFTSNNTIFGTQFHQWPETSIPLVCDMSSDIFSRSIPVERFGLIYAGAQKNMGPAGTTLVIVRKDLLGKSGRVLPTMLNYETHIAKNSSFNTPPVLPIYVSMLTLQWLKEQGGVESIAQRNQDKADLLYQAIDRSPIFRGTTAREDRSLMNATFVLENDELNPLFLSDCSEAGIVGIKGHRSVGGFRASIYNAMPKESIQVLVDVMEAFTQKYG